MGFDLDRCHISLTVCIIYSINIFLRQCCGIRRRLWKSCLGFRLVKVGIMHICCGEFSPLPIKNPSGWPIALFRPTRFPNPLMLSICFDHFSFRTLPPIAPVDMLHALQPSFYIWSSVSVLALFQAQNTYSFIVIKSTETCYIFFLKPENVVRN